MEPDMSYEIVDTETLMRYAKDGGLAWYEGFPSEETYVLSFEIVDEPREPNVARLEGIND